jgi:choline-sulfatase
MQRWTAMLAALAAVACGAEEAEVPLPLAEQAPPTAPGEAPAEAPASATYYDLARYPMRAELRQGDAWIVDLGTDGGHRHTLGGWRTRAGHRHTFEDGTTATVLSGVTGLLVLPIEAPGQCTLHLRLRAITDRAVTLYVDDETVGHVRLPRDGWEVAEVVLPPEQCTVGEHFLRLRVARAGRLEGLRRAAVAVDWMRLGPAGDGDEGPPSLADGIPPGWRVAHPFEVPEGARFRTRVRSGGLRLRIVPDGAGRPSESDHGAGDVDVSLSAHVGRVVRLELEATGAAPLRLEGPRVVAPPLGPSRRLETRPRNVLVILEDTLRADRLRPYAPDTRVATPGLDALAGRAATFLAAHAQENWTKPSVATLLSGLYPWTHTATREDSRVPASVELLSERLGDEGFHVGAFVANGFVSDRFGFRQGWAAGFRNYVREGRRNQARFVVDDALEWLDARPSDRPFFLYVHTIDPHVPYSPPSEDLARYDADPYGGPVDFRRDRTLLEAVKAGRLRLNARDRRRLIALYDGEITYHDRHLARLLEGLATRGLDEDTLVVFTSDHGEELFDHGSVGHGHSVWEELIRVPLLIRIPGLTDGGARLDGPASLVDVMPTVLDALGLERGDALQGRSLLPRLLGRRPSAPPATVTGFLEGWRTVVAGRFKLVQRTAHRIQLYDLVEDPGETEDLAAERPLTVRYLRGLLGLYLAEAEGGHVEEREEIDPALRRQLEALGYVGTQAAPR